MRQPQFNSFKQPCRISSVKLDYLSFPPTPLATIEMYPVPPHPITPSDGRSMSRIQLPRL